MDAITYKPHGIMITQEYKTTVGAIFERLETGKIDRVSVDLQGVDVKVENPECLDVTDETQTIHVREYRHDTHSERFEERRNVRIHREWLEAPDGRL